MERDKDEIGDNRPPSKSRQDYDDLQNEMAGRDVGRIRRFFTGAADPGMIERRRGERDGVTISQLLALLNADPEYAALHREAMVDLQRYETATETARGKAEQRLDGIEVDLAAMSDAASTLPDGTKVFRGKDGNVYTEDGRQLTDDERSQVEWKEGAPSYEEYLAKQQDAERARQEIDELRRYQTDVLGHARNRLTDEHNPPSKGEIRKLQEGIRNGLPQFVAHRPDMITDEAPTASANVALPPPRQ